MFMNICVIVSIIHIYIYTYIIYFQKFEWKLRINNGQMYSLELHLQPELILKCSSSEQMFFKRSSCLPPLLPKSIDHLIKDFEIKISNSQYSLPLKKIQFVSHVSCEYLLNFDFNLQALSKDGNSILHMLVKIKDQGILKLLISKFENVDLKNKEGQTALHVACLFNRREHARILLENHAQVNSRDKNNGTPIMALAASLDKTCDIEFYKLLIKYGANVYSENNFHEMAIDLAKGFSNKRADTLAAYLDP